MVINYQINERKKITVMIRSSHPRIGVYLVSHAFTVYEFPVIPDLCKHGLFPKVRDLQTSIYSPRVYVCQRVTIGEARLRFSPDGDTHRTLSMGQKQKKH